MNSRKQRNVFLIHIWVVEEGGKRTCRASIEAVRDHERVVFSGLDSLLDYIKDFAQALEAGGELSNEKEHPAGKTQDQTYCSSG
jgi:hypothetical protein